VIVWITHIRHIQVHEFTSKHIVFIIKTNETTAHQYHLQRSLRSHPHHTIPPSCAINSLSSPFCYETNECKAHYDSITDSTKQHHITIRCNHINGSTKVDLFFRCNSREQNTRHTTNPVSLNYRHKLLQSEESNAFAKQTTATLTDLLALVATKHWINQILLLQNEIHLVHTQRDDKKTNRINTKTHFISKFARSATYRGLLHKTTKCRNFIVHILLLIVWLTYTINTHRFQLMCTSFAVGEISRSRAGAEWQHVPCDSAHSCKTLIDCER
jgi:hypothetical protein